MNKYLLPMVAIAMAITILMGAMGAHALKSVISNSQLDSYETALRYQLVHLLALLLTGLMTFQYKKISFKWVIRFFTCGILCFSGSIYMIIYLQHQAISIPRVLFLLTPLGGLCLTIGWITLAAFLYKGIAQQVEN
jgi:uncharacterized membrane protein YgdD (TMEM256/DUF423 family)